MIPYDDWPKWVIIFICVMIDDDDPWKAIQSTKKWTYYPTPPNLPLPYILS